MSLSALVRGVVKALCDAQQAIPHAREEHLHCHMEQEENGSYTPKTITVNVDDDRRVVVPTYTLSSVNTIGIESATIKCSARIVDMTTAEKCGEMTCGENHAVFEVHPSQGGKSSFEMEIKFQQREPSESESRLVESLDSMVVESVEDL